MPDEASDLPDLGPAADDVELDLLADEPLLEDPLLLQWPLAEAPPRRVEAVTGREVLPWRTRAELPDLGLEVPAWLDPSRETSVWVVTEPPQKRRITTRVRLGGVEIEAVLAVESGQLAGLHVGRDLLGDRILVSARE